MKTQTKTARREEESESKQLGSEGQTHCKDRDRKRVGMRTYGVYQSNQTLPHNMPCVCLRNLVTVITLGSTRSITRSKASSDFILHISFKFPLGKRRREIPPLVKTIQKIQKEET